MIPMNGFVSPRRATLLLISNDFWLCFANKIFFCREASARVRLLAGLSSTVLGLPISRSLSCNTAECEHTGGSLLVGCCAEAAAGVCARAQSQGSMKALIWRARANRSAQQSATALR